MTTTLVRDGQTRFACAASVLPLLQVRTVQTAQGMSMDSCIMLLSRYGNMGEDDWWLHVYVMLSRVRTAARILLYGLPSRSLFERGPPAYLSAGIARIGALAQAREQQVTPLAVANGLWLPEFGDGEVGCTVVVRAPQLAPTAQAAMAPTSFVSLHSSPSGDMV